MFEICSARTTRFPSSEIGLPQGYPLPENAGTHVGPYKLLQEVGEGGMETVLLAEQLESARRKEGS